MFYCPFNTTVPIRLVITKGNRIRVDCANEIYIALRVEEVTSLKLKVK